MFGMSVLGEFGDSSEGGEGLPRGESGVIDLWGGFGDHSLGSMESLFEWLFESFFHSFPFLE